MVAAISHSDTAPHALRRTPSPVQHVRIQQPPPIVNGDPDDKSVRPAVAERPPVIRKPSTCIALRAPKAVSEDDPTNAVSFLDPAAPAERYSIDVEAPIDRTVDELRALLSDSGFVGLNAAEQLARELVIHVVLPRGASAVVVTGPRGSGRHTIANAAHLVGEQLLGRSGPLHRLFVAIGGARRDLAATLRAALASAQHGTLIIEGAAALDAMEQEALSTLLTQERGDVLTVIIADEPLSSLGVSESFASICTTPLRDRASSDVVQLTAHFIHRATQRCGTTLDAPPAMLDACCAAVFQAKLTSVRELQFHIQHAVFTAQMNPERDIVTTLQARLKTFASPTPLPADALALATPLVPIDDELLEDLSKLHGIEVGLLRHQVALIHEFSKDLGDRPASFRNIMDKTDRVRRIALWASTGARNQAGFRKSFGPEGFMRPSKSVAWAFYNTAFKRD